jgi:diguanylate cyclase (GGDEF)-like protein/PAS domain S-box-containing protein
LPDGGLILKSIASDFRTTMLVALVAFVAVFGAGEVAGWRSAVERYEQEMVGTARRLLQHARDTFESAHLPLVALAEDLESHGTTKDALTAIDRRIARQVQASERLSKLLVVGSDGFVLAGAGREKPKLTFSGQHFFGVHRSSTSRQINIGKPILNPFGQGWVIPVTQRFSTTDGHFGGVVAAFFETGYFANIYEKAKVRPDDVLLLANSEGRILATLPSHARRIGSITKLESIVSIERKPKFAAYHYLSSVREEPRIAGLAESPRTGLVALVGMSQADVMSDWIKSVWPRWLLAAALIVISSLLCYRLHTQEKRRQESERLRIHREDEFRQLAESSSDLILRLCDEGRCSYVSPACKSLLAFEAEELLGKHVLSTVHTDDRPMVEQAFAHLRNCGQRKRVEYRGVRKDGRIIWLETTLSKLTAADEGGDIVAIARDVTQNKERHQVLLQTASTDALTGLANRGIFDERIQEMIIESFNSRRPLSLLMIDADNFKLFNDSYGHIAGDDCLRSIASVLESCTRPGSDLVTRYGGEEFAVLLADTDLVGGKEIAAEICKKVSALEIQHCNNRPYGFVTVSIGIGMLNIARQHENSPLDLIKQADAALYEAKAAGRNTYAVGNTELSPARSLTAA